MSHIRFIRSELSVGHMIQAESDNAKRDEYLKRLMSLPNQKWAEIIGQASQSIDILKNQDVIRSVLNILQTNTSVASSLGPHFFPQISLIFLDMLTVYSINTSYLVLQMMEWWDSVLKMQPCMDAKTLRRNFVIDLLMYEGNSCQYIIPKNIQAHLTLIKEKNR